MAHKNDSYVGKKVKLPDGRVGVVATCDYDGDLYIDGVLPDHPVIGKIRCYVPDYKAKELEVLPD
jgi:hypothetical protein